MKPNILLTVVVAVLLSTSGAHAQKVESNLTDGHPVINCEGMPTSAYTTTKKSNAMATLKTKTANDKVYKRFAVSNVDNAERATWSEAFTVCNALSGGWRLPTQRELQLIWVLKRALELKGTNITKFIGTYWSATEYNAKDGTSWDVVFSGFNPDDTGDTGGNTDFGGATSTNNQTRSYNVRCIRDLQ